MTLKDLYDAWFQQPGKQFNVRIEQNHGDGTANTKIYHGETYVPAMYARLADWWDAPVRCWAIIDKNTIIIIVK